ncbi:hypothetical protein [Streptomyces incanus]|uniref:Uncharacterized protein n=1 Tax=Streptomyces incanus TaxID=887453 RepID=A0ABW0XT08_9ACTN
MDETLTEPFGGFTATADTDATPQRSAHPAARRLWVLCSRTPKSSALPASTRCCPADPVSPYVLPGALAADESGAVTGRKPSEAAAVVHEMTCRIGKAMVDARDMTESGMKLAPVAGYARSAFGAASAARSRSG